MFYKWVVSFLTVTLLFSAFLWSHPSTAHALDCAEPVSAAEAYEKAIAVFSGYVEEENSYIYTLQVDEVYKGSVEETVKLKGSEWDKPIFQSDKKLLIYSNETSFGQYKIDPCGRTNAFEQLHDDTKDLEATKPDPVPLLTPPMWAAITVGVAGGLFIFIKRLRNRS